MRRTGEPVSLIMADLDHFKLVNDRYGHRAGDEVLIEAAKRMSSCLRPYDIIGRIGGEEFLVVVPECETPGGVVVAERIREIIGGEDFKIPTGQISVTISMGVATAKKDSTLDNNHLVLAADKALYSAKGAGRNTIHTAESNE
jgi:diguanylate cyclase (GGDEF)-like protein